MTSTDILMQTVQYSSSGIGEETQTMIKSNVINSSDFLMAKQISSTAIDERGQSSFEIIMYGAISVFLAALGTVAVILLILLRRRNASQSGSKFGNLVNSEHTDESATEMDYDSFFDQTAFENPSSCTDNLSGVIAEYSSSTEELF
jgi:hypothetical protein